jgi:hypothetical protein
MSFKLFIYYCALCGGWAAFLAWALVAYLGIPAVRSDFLRAILIGGVLGALLAAALGTVDGFLNAVGSQRYQRALFCLGLGFLGGLVGGFLGELLHQASFPIVIGWLLAGVLIGGSVGAFDLLRARLNEEDPRAALKKTLNGVYGGLLGGLLGGLPFGFLAGSPALPSSSLTIGLVALGVCIGLSVGLAQVILKEAWLKVESGFRAGRELLLTKGVTTIGRAEGCDLGLFGDNTIAKTHARILLQNNRYLLADAGSETGTFLNDEPVTAPTPLRSGDVIKVGKSILVFGERQKRPHNH